MSFASGTSVQASIIYEQLNTSGVLTPNASFGRIISNTISYTNANYPTTDGVPVYMKFTVKQANALSDGNFYGVFLEATSGVYQCAGYIFTSGDKTLLSDGNYHTFEIATNQNYGASSCSSNSTGKIVGYIGSGGEMIANGANTIQYIEINSSSFPPPNTSSRIDTFTYSTTTAKATVTGYWNASSSNKYDKLYFYQFSDTLGQESQQQISATTSGSFNIQFDWLPTYTVSSSTATTTAPLPFNVVLHAKLYSYNSASYCFGCNTTTYETLIQATSTGTVSTSPYTYNFDNPRGLSEYPEYECSISSITGCFKNAGIWLFYPAKSSTEQFKSLTSELSSRSPFAYVYAVPELFNELFNAESTASTTISVTIYDGKPNEYTFVFLSAGLLNAVPYSATIRTILGWILWLMLIQAFYYQVIRVHDNNTPHH